MSNEVKIIHPTKFLLCAQLVNEGQKINPNSNHTDINMQDIEAFRFFSNYRIKKDLNYEDHHGSISTMLELIHLTMQYNSEDDLINDLITAKEISQPPKGKQWKLFIKIIVSKNTFFTYAQLLYSKHRNWINISTDGTPPNIQPLIDALYKIRDTEDYNTLKELAKLFEESKNTKLKNITAKIIRLCDTTDPRSKQHLLSETTNGLNPIEAFIKEIIYTNCNTKNEYQYNWRYIYTIIFFLTRKKVLEEQNNKSQSPRHKRALRKEQPSPASQTPSNYMQLTFEDLLNKQ